MVAGLCLLAAAIGAGVAVTVLWARISGALAEDGSVELLVVGCLVEAVGMMIAGVLLARMARPEPD